MYIKNLRRGLYELVLESLNRHLRGAAAFDEITSKL